MTATALFRHGTPCMVDHTPTAAVALGDVLVVGDTIRIAHRAIPANTKGALAACGGVYQLPKAAGAGSGIADGKKVYWDAAGKVITTTAAGHQALGYTVGASADADTTQLVCHLPV